MINYRSLPKAPKQVEAQLKTLQGEELCLFLLSLSEVDNWKLAQDIYLKYINNEDKWIASAAITGLGHVARISKMLEKEMVVQTLKKTLAKRPELEGKINDTLNDILIFLK